jgi:hypothetical protein
MMFRSNMAFSALSGWMTTKSETAFFHLYYCFYCIIFAFGGGLRILSRADLPFHFCMALEVAAMAASGLFAPK